MKKMVKDFVHRQGVHCDSSALRDIFEHHGFRFPKPMISSLGIGLGFVYWKSKHMPFPLVGGRVRNLAENLCPNIGVTMKCMHTNSQNAKYILLEIADDEERILCILDTVEMWPSPQLFNAP